MTETEIRNDWYSALEAGEAKGSKLNWGFFPQDLMVLTCLYKAGYFREKIIDLLEDCNFHTEAGLLDDQKYDECLKVIIDDMLEDY